MVPIPRVHPVLLFAPGLETPACSAGWCYNPLFWQRIYSRYRSTTHQPQMIFFSVRHDITPVINGTAYTLHAPPPTGGNPDSVAPAFIYCTTVSSFIALGQALVLQGMEPPLRIIPETRIRSRHDFPVELGQAGIGEFERNQYYSGIRSSIDPGLLHPPSAALEHQLRALPRKRIDLAVINGFGPGIGDTLAGLTAFRVARNKLLEHSESVNTTVMVTHSALKNTEAVLQQSGVINNIRTLPVTLEELCTCNAFMDTGGMAHFPDFDTLVPVDFFLKSFGIDYRTVDAGLKRNRIGRPGDPDPGLIEMISRLRNTGDRLLLFHPQASTPLRSVPASQIRRISGELLQDGGYRIVCAVPLGFEQEGITDISACSTGYAEFCYIISSMDAILTVDTSVYHIADCYDIPCVVWFSSIAPEKRIKYYPFVSGILLEGARESGFMNRHFSRHGDELEPVSTLWKSLDVKRSLELLESVRTS